METNGFIQYEIIINVLVNFCFRFIQIHMLWVYGHYKCLIIPVRGPTSDVRI